MRPPPALGWHPALVVSLVLLIAGTLGACGSKGASAPAHSWAPGASPIPAASIPAQKGTTTGFRSSTGGWGFKPTVDIEVTDLGSFDDSGNGLLHSHTVGIFDAGTQKLLAQVTVQPDSPLDGTYRFASITPDTLRAGRSYVVAALSVSPFDPEVNGPKGLVWSPEIQYGGYREVSTGTFAFPGQSSYFFITANFKYRPVSVSSVTP